LTCKRAWFQSLNLKCDEPLSDIDFNFNLRRYITDVHDRFKSLVETLLSDFLGEMGVSADMFVEIVANSVHLQLNSFVLASILTVVGRHVIHHIVHRSSTGATSTTT
jgi:hypothetical protein